MLPSYLQTAQMFTGILRDRGIILKPGDKVLDFGCGSGQLVEEWRKQGFDAYGVDIKPFWASNPQMDQKFYAVSEPSPYRLPFPDNTFDFISSTSVFEHVLDYEACFKEIHRVLKKDRFTMHMFPGPWVLPVEPHIYVPFASMIQNRLWLSIWALAGIRNEYQQKMTWKEVVDANLRYCKTGIHYVARSKVKKMVTRIFGNVQYPKHEYIRHSPGGAGRLGRQFPIPGYADFIFACREQVLLMKKT